MNSRGAERPDDEADLRKDAGSRKGRRFGRGRAEPEVPEDVPQEETGWLDDLRTAKQQRGAIGPGTLAGETRPSKSGRMAPGPDDHPDDEDLPFGGGAAGWQSPSGSFPSGAAPTSPAQPGRPAGGPAQPGRPAGGPA
ncbi:MAG TPA: hypothetical protein VFW27_22075, partial [Actinoplanes sp.]|nr:hypothetical protein [Actinoplanes sp.]